MIFLNSQHKQLGDKKSSTNSTHSDLHVPARKRSPDESVPFPSCPPVSPLSSWLFLLDLCKISGWQDSSIWKGKSFAKSDEMTSYVHVKSILGIFQKISKLINQVLAISAVVTHSLCLPFVRLILKHLLSVRNIICIISLPEWNIVQGVSI